MQECSEGKFKEAAETASNAPNGALRTQATITQLQGAPTVAGQKSPLIVYFGSLLQKGQLNAIESVEMSRIALSQNRPDLVSNWMRDNKLTPSEPLGDLLKDVCTALLLTFSLLNVLYNLGKIPNKSVAIHPTEHACVRKRP